MGRGGVFPRQPLRAAQAPAPSVGPWVSEAHGSPADLSRCFFALGTLV